MARCDQCGNDSGRTFRIEIGGRRLTFDSFECAIEMAAPRCEHCDCRIIGHGHEHNGQMFCCAPCAAKQGAEAERQRA